MVKLLNLKNKNSVNYIDIKGHWAEEYAEIISGYRYNDNKKIELTSGYAYIFMPDMPIQRNDVAYIMVEALEIQNEEYNDMKDFPFIDFVDYWAQHHVGLANKFGIMKGTAFNQFSGNENLTRAQVAKLMCNVLEAKEKLNISDISLNTDIIEEGGQVINNSEGIYVNAAGERLSYCDAYQNEPNAGSCFGIFESSKENISGFISEKMQYLLDSNRFICTVKNQDDIFTKYNDYDIDNNVEFAIFMEYQYDKCLIDTYQLSNDKTKFISQKRGEKYDFVKIQNEYSMEEYLKEQYDLDSKLSGVFSFENKIYRMIETKNYAFNNRKCISVLSDELYGNTEYYFEEDKNKPMTFVLSLFLKEKDLSEIKAIYSNFYYVNYYTGMIAYNNGTVEEISIEMSKESNVAKVQINYIRPLIKVETYTQDNLKKDLMDRNAIHY